MIRDVCITLIVFSIIASMPLSGQQQKGKNTHFVDKENNAERLRRYSMSKNDIDAFLWVEQNLFKWIIKDGVDATLARARTEIATARAFGMEPSNWAKRDIGVFVENERIFQEKRADVEKRLKAAQDYSERVDHDMMDADPKWNPLKYASMYWFESSRKADPNNPYSIAIEKERKIEYERNQLYKQFNKETPEQRVGGGIAILLSMVIFGAAGEEVELTGEAEAALRSLGEARAALVVSEGRAAMTSIMEARSILIASEEARAALVAVEEARAALVAGEIDMSITAVKHAQAALSAQLQVNPAAALALANANEVIAKLDSAEKADADIGLSEKAKIDLFVYSSKHQDDVKQFLAADLKVASDFVAQYKTLAAKGKIVPMKADDKVIRRGPTNEIHKSENPTNTAVKQDELKGESNVSLASAGRVLMPMLGKVTFNNETRLTFRVYSSSGKLVNVVLPHQRREINLAPGNYYHVGGGKTRNFTVKGGRSLSLNFLRQRSY